MSQCGEQQGARSCPLNEPERAAVAYLERAGKGANPASLGRYRASISKIHQLLDLKDPTQAELVKLGLRAIRREKGSAQAVRCASRGRPKVCIR